MKLAMLIGLLIAVVAYQAWGSSAPLEVGVGPVALHQGVPRLQPPAGQFDQWDSGLPVLGWVDQVQGRAGPVVGIAGEAGEVPGEPARPLPLSTAQRSDILTAAEITVLALRVSGDAEFAVFIGPSAYCESSGRPTATGSALERGLTMMHPVHRPELAKLGVGYEWSRQYEPEVNLRSAYWLWDRDGEDPWESTRGCWG